MRIIGDSYLALHVYIHLIMENTVVVTLSKNIIRNAWDMTHEQFTAHGVGAVATFCKRGKCIAQVLVTETYTMGSRNEFDSEAEAIQSVRERALSIHGFVLV